MEFPLFHSILFAKENGCRSIMLKQKEKRERIKSIKEECYAISVKCVVTKDWRKGCSSGNLKRHWNWSKQCKNQYKSDHRSRMVVTLNGFGYLKLLKLNERWQKLLKRSFQLNETQFFFTLYWMEHKYPETKGVENKTKYFTWCLWIFMNKKHYMTFANNLIISMNTYFQLQIHIMLIFSWLIS